MTFTASTNSLQICSDKYCKEIKTICKAGHHELKLHSWWEDEHKLKARYTIPLLPECLHYSPALSRRINDPAALQTLMWNSWCSCIWPLTDPHRNHLFFSTSQFSLEWRWWIIDEIVQYQADSSEWGGLWLVPKQTTKVLWSTDKIKLNLHPLQCKINNYYKMNHKCSQPMYFHIAD